MRRVLVIVIILGVWEAIRRFNIVGPLLLASPSEIVDALITSGPEFFFALRFTFVEIAAALVVAWILGIGMGIIAGMIPFLNATAGPLLSSLFAVPLITWYPLFMVWFGIGMTSKIAYAVVSGFFPIAINTMNGIHGLDRRYSVFAEAIGCSRGQAVFRILLPMALPSIMSGLRIGTALVVIGVLVAEMLASLGGNRLPDFVLPVGLCNRSRLSRHPVCTRVCAVHQLGIELDRASIYALARSAGRRTVTVRADGAAAKLSRRSSARYAHRRRRPDIDCQSSARA